MTYILFALVYAFSLYLVHRKAHIKGYACGMEVGLIIFRSKLPVDTYRTICEARVREIDALLEVKR